MKTIQTKAATILVLALVFLSISNIKAQDSLPEWMTNLPVKKGYVYGAGAGKSANLSIADDKAHMDAMVDLANNYSGKFETFSLKCDTILGAGNNARQIITKVTSSQQATLTGVEVVDKIVVKQESLNVVYTLLRMDISNDIKRVQKEIEGDAALRKKMNKKGLLKDLKGL